MDNVSIREFNQRFADYEKTVNQRFVDFDKAVNAALASSEKAVDKAEKNAEKWRESANEWRSAMSEKDNRFALKTDTERMEENIRQLELSKAEISGKAAQWTVWIGYLLGIAAIGVALWK